MRFWLVGPIIISLFNFISDFQRYFFNPVYQEIADELQLGGPCPNLTISNLTSSIISETAPFCENKNLYILLTTTLFVPLQSLSQVLFGILADRNPNSTVKIFVTVAIGMGISVFALTYSSGITTFVLLRLVFAVFYAGIDPLAAKEIFKVTKPEQRGKTMAMYNWAMYMGFGFAFGVEGRVGWREMYRFSVWSIIPCLALFLGYQRWGAGFSEHDVKNTDGNEISACLAKTETIEEELTTYDTIILVIKSFLKPNVFVLLIACIFRTIAAVSYATFGFRYFNEKFPDYGNTRLWLMTAPVFGGMVGITLGGIATDFVVKKKWFLKKNTKTQTSETARSRMIVKSVSQILAGPVAYLAINTPTPYCFVFLTFAFVLSEMWYGVLFAVLFEIVPEKYNTTFFGVFVFAFVNISAQIFGLLDVERVFEFAVQYFYPFGYSISGIFFFVAFLLTE